MEELVINADPKNIAKVENFIDLLQQKNNISDDVFDNILISVTEAVNNSIIHGSKSDASKEVKVKYDILDGKKIVFYITDSGPGFNFSNLPDPTAPENIDSPCGRGVFLMKHLADLVIFSNNGNTVELHFKL